jgi:hypothetical protein
MSKLLPPVTAALLAACALLPARGEDARPAVPAFRTQELDTRLEIGYAVLIADVNNDGKPDVIVVDTTRVYWYENPTWKRRTIIEGMTRRDNVCAAAYDIDGDGKLDLALGADWHPSNTREGGTLQWLRQGKNVDDPWALYSIAEEPTVHRIRFIDLYAEGKPRLVVAPLQGRNTTAAKNWMDGSPVRVLAYSIPKDPTKDRWVPEVIDESLHVVHNFTPVPAASGRGMDVLTASYEGVSLLRHDKDARWTGRRLGQGNQDNPNSNRGSSEVKQGRRKDGKPFLATIEPWHGHQVVVYTPPADNNDKALWDRHVLDDKLKWGHAVWCADLDGDGGDEIVVGVRDDLSGKPGERRGVRVYKALDDTATKWARHDVDPGGVAVEDLAAADLDGDGRIDLIAVGRQTRNLRIYWNEGKK